MAAAAKAGLIWKADWCFLSVGEDVVSESIVLARGLGKCSGRAGAASREFWELVASKLGAGSGGSSKSRVDAGRRRGAVGRGGESGEGVEGSGASEFGSFKAETVRDIKAEKGMEEETSEISGGLSMSLCRREVPAMGWGAARESREVPADER